MKKLVILQTVVPDYRIRFFSYLQEQLGPNFTLYGGGSYFESSVQTPKGMTFLNEVQNHFLFGRRLLVQTGMWREALYADVLVLELNPRILSNWLLLFLRWPGRKKTVLWGHAWPRAGKESGSDRLRHLMRLLSDALIVYTTSQQVAMREKMPGKKVLSAPNALYFRQEMRVNKSDMEKINHILFSGRLTPSKKPMLLLLAFASALERLPETCNLLLIGSGEEEPYLKTEADRLQIAHRVHFFGRLYDGGELQALYDASLISVSPGYAGLSAIQSFGFGVPMLIADKEDHAPEIEAAAPGWNSLFFRSDDVNDLAKKITFFFDNKKYWTEKRQAISVACRENYSIESMTEPFIKLTRDQ